MKTSIQQVKADIKSGKSKRIYYSSRTLWWTHLDSDLEEATKLGAIASAERHEKFMADPKISKEDKDRIQGLLSSIKEHDKKRPAGIGPLPTDPDGSPLYQLDDCMKWITSAEKRPEHFGEFGLFSFIMTHHQNMPPENIFMDWAGVNDHIRTSAINCCINHPDYKVPLIYTMAFMGSEWWCPYCGANSGLMDKADTVSPMTLELCERDMKYREATKSYLRARSISVCSETEWEGKMVKPMDLPLEERQRIQSVIEKGWERFVKLD